MTRTVSEINYSAIATDYPVAGQDNNSQGFRDNFAAIQEGLSQAKTEITELRQKAVLSEKLLPSTDPELNDLNGSTIKNGLYVQFNGVVNNPTVISTNDFIDLEDGPLQVLPIGASITLTFKNWSPNAGANDLDPQYRKIRVHLYSNSATERTVILSTNEGGARWAEDSFDINAVVLPDTQNHIVFEAWSYDNGDNVYFKYIGEFAQV